MARKPRVPAPVEDQGASPHAHPLTPTQSTLDALASRVAADPDDDTLRLVYADCLDENDKPVEAALIRAEIAIKMSARNKVSALDAAALAARQETILAWRAMATEGVAQDDPAYPVCVLLAMSLEIEPTGTEYPYATVPEVVRGTIRRAAAAELLPDRMGGIMVGALRLSSDARGVAHGRPACWDADCNAYNAAKIYRSANAQETDNGR